MLPTIQFYAQARSSLRQIFKENGIIVNDNHVGTIGELYAKIYLESFGLSVRPAKNLIWPYDLEDSLGIKYSVKTITTENTLGKTSPVNILEDWTVLIAISLDGDFMLEKMAMIIKSHLISYPVFQKNINNRSNGSKSHPQFSMVEVLG
ncbi:hypothetical protein GC093_16915 [Paenibacillus sp. LMG 31456]|uniref:Uncharacterized protein n=1 Tax=Paenibacillus foliorum TaxID=2654974 RepID=A0A972GXV5_9BACL|nr:hypothetical protein [Paenibacillus foliorum]NOU94890.1 hypothetical protein [Paenibacillus foliorum]